MVLNTQNKLKMNVIIISYRKTIGAAAAQKRARIKMSGFIEPKRWFERKILVQFNQLIPCGYCDI
jgi:hypothetical protein